MPLAEIERTGDRRDLGITWKRKNKLTLELAILEK